MSFWVYVLRCADGSYYTGHSDDLERRIMQHRHGEYPGYTRDRRPVELMFAETFATREEALVRERQVKDWSRRKKEALFRSDWKAVSDAARSRPGVSTALDAGSNRTEGIETAARSLPIDNPSPPRPGNAEIPARFGPLENPAPSRTGAGKASVRFEPVENPAPSRTEAIQPQPVIVLVRPQLGQNIGKAARAMLNFGLTGLRLVAPRDGWPNPEAGPAASGADAVLDGAELFDTVAAAVADCTHVYATTVRRRGVSKPVVTPAEAAAAIHAAPGRAAILFGPERSGLETDDVALARTIVTVPINPGFGSLNLAQAVILVAYEWSRHAAGGLAQPPAVPGDPPAPQAELDGMIAQLDAMLVDAGFYFPPDRVPTTRRTLRTILTRPGWSAQEVRTLRGVLSALATPRPR